MPKPPIDLPVVLVPHPHVRVDTAVLGGSPHVVGSKVPVRRIFAFFRDGVKVETILKRFPQLGAARVLDALAFALDNPEVIDADTARESALLRQAGLPSTKGSTAGRQMALPFEGPENGEK